MSSGTEAQRRSACQVLIALGGPAGLGALVSALQDSAPDIRDRAADALLGQFREFANALQCTREGASHPLTRDGWEPALWESLESVLLGLPQHGRREFFAVLPQLGSEAAPVVANLLTTRNNSTLRAAVVEAMQGSAERPAVELTLALATHGAREVHEAGRQLVLDREDPEFATTVAEVVASCSRDLEDPVLATPWASVVPPVATTLEPAVARRLITSLRHLDPAERDACIVAFLAHRDEQVLLKVAKLIVDVAMPQRAELLTPLIASENAELRQLAVQEVSKVSFEVYLKRFDGLAPEARQIAARAVAKIDHTMLDRLAEEVGSLDAKTRFKALQIVGYLNAEEELRTALMALLDDPDKHVRATALRLVELTGSVPGMKALIDALSDPDRRVRANAIETFESLDDDCYLEIFLPFLHDRDNRVRANAAKALWNLGHPGGRETLTEMLHDDDELMRMSAVWALGELGTDDAMLLIAEREVCEPSAPVLDKIREVRDAPTRTGGAP